MPAVSRSGCFGIEPRAETPAQIHKGVMGFRAEKRIAGIGLGLFFQHGMHSRLGQHGRADGIPIFTGQGTIQGEIFHELLSGAEGFQPQTGKGAIGSRIE